MRILLTAMFSFMMCTTVMAAPKKKVCKELKSAQCKKRTKCTWVKRSKRKDGSSVKGYCRKSGKKK